MPFKYCKLLRVRLYCVQNISKCSTNKSTVFIPGKYATSNTPTVIPDLNVGETLGGDKLAEMETNLSFRSGDRKTNVDLRRILSEWERLCQIEKDIEKLEYRRQEITRAFQTVDDEDTRKEIKKEAKDIKKSIKALTNERWNIEETALIDYLRLPNFLDKKTPTKDKILEEFGNMPQFKSEHQLVSHTEAYKDDIEFSQDSPTSYYLFGVVAQLERELNEVAQDFLLNSGFHIFSGPDFTRSAIVEGCRPHIRLFNDNAAKDMVFSLAPTSDFGDVLSGSGTHLVGSASVESFVGHLVKNIIINPGSCLPITYFCTGRQYVPIKIDTAPNLKNSLYNTQQSTAIQLSCIASTISSLEDQLQSIMLIIKEFYSKIGLYCRITMCGATNIDPAGSMKICILVYSPYLKDYVEVGNLVVYNTFLSKRLMLVTEDIHTDELKELHILSGTFMNVTKLIGCVIENYQLGSNEDQSNFKEGIKEFLRTLSTSSIQ